MASSRDNVRVIAGGVVGGMLVGYLHVFVLAHLAFLISAGAYKYVGALAFFLNGTASAFLTAMIVGVPIGSLLPRLAVALALVIGAVAAAVLVYLSAVTTSERWWWVSFTDALQLPVLLILGAWLG